MDEKRLIGNFKKLDNASLPEEIIIYYSRLSNLIQMTISVIIAIAGILCLTVFKEASIGFVFTCTGTYLGIKKYRQATNSSPQIIINNKGLQTASTPFYRWDEVNGVKTIRAGSYKYPKTYLTYKHPKGLEQFLVEDMEVNRQTLSRLLSIYKRRFKQVNNALPHAHH